MNAIRGRALAIAVAIVLVSVERALEAIRPQIGSGSPEAVIEAANTALSAWEQRDPDVRGPRVASVNQIDGSVTLR